MCVCVYICSVPSNSRVLMLLGQLEKMDGDVSGKNVDTTRQVTAKILHLIQTQGKQNKATTKNNLQTYTQIGMVLYRTSSFLENWAICTSSTRTQSALYLGIVHLISLTWPQHMKFLLDHSNKLLVFHLLSAYRKLTQNKIFVVCLLSLHGVMIQSNSN